MVYWFPRRNLKTEKTSTVLPKEQACCHFFLNCCFSRLGIWSGLSNTNTKNSLCENFEHIKHYHHFFFQDTKWSAVFRVTSENYMCLQFTLSSYFQCRLLSVTSPVTEWLSSGPISGVFLHNPSFVAQLVSAWPSVREVPSSIPGNTTSFSFNFSPLHTCQLSRIIWKSP